jgi:hypothetical protein
VARHEPSPAARIDRVRSLRVHERDDALTPEFQRLARDLKRTHQRVGSAGEAWAEIVPAHLAQGAVLEGVSRGVLTVRVPNQPARYVLDRWLRAGGQSQLAQRAGVRSVKVVVGGSPNSL